MKYYVGIDLGSSSVTHSLLSEEGYFISDHITFKSDLDPHEIHKIIQSKIFELVDSALGEDNEFHVFIESVFSGINPRTFSRMTRVAHSIYITWSEFSNSIRYIEPSSWRKILFGKGNKKKIDCQNWAYDNYSFLLELPKSQRDHQADALMISLSCREEVGR